MPILEFYNTYRKSDWFRALKLFPKSNTLVVETSYELTSIELNRLPCKLDDMNVVYSAGNSDLIFGGTKHNSY